MKKILSTLALVSALFSTQASFANGAAGGPDLRAFFGKLEGRWQGKGSLLQQGPNAPVREKAATYRIELNIDRPGSMPNWSAVSETRYDTGVIAPYSVNYGVRGDTLFVSNFSGTEPVTVTEATPTSLAYNTRRSDVLTGQIYEYSFNYTLDGRTLTARIVTRFQGAALSEENFVVRK